MLSIIIVRLLQTGKNSKKILSFSFLLFISLLSLSVFVSLILIIVCDYRDLTRSERALFFSGRLIRSFNKLRRGVSNFVLLDLSKIARDLFFLAALELCSFSLQCSVIQGVLSVARSCASRACWIEWEDALHVCMYFTNYRRNHINIKRKLILLRIFFRTTLRVHCV